MHTHICKSVGARTHIYTRARTHAGVAWECIRVSEGYCFIRANFIQLLSDSTPGEKHIQAHTYASPPGLREIIVYLYKCSGKKACYALFHNYQAILIQSCLPGGRWRQLKLFLLSKANCGCLANHFMLSTFQFKSL